jgi:hypothetical protein
MGSSSCSSLAPACPPPQTSPDGRRRRRSPATLDSAEGWVRSSRAWLESGKEEGRKKGAGVIADFTGHLTVTMAELYFSRRGSGRGCAVALWQAKRGRWSVHRVVWRREWLWAPFYS